MRTFCSLAPCVVSFFFAQSSVANESIPRELECHTQAQPNPIAGQFPDTPTGVLNGTIALLPVDLQVARQFVPQQYPILTSAYKKLLPWWPDNKYPVILQANIDYDVRQGNLSPSFSFSRASLYFPFVDRLNDGYTSMSYSSKTFVSDNLIAVAGTLLYGNTIIVGSFDPPCDGYRSFGGNQSLTGFNVTPAVSLSQDAESISGRFQRTDASPITMEFWRNVTNQPQCGPAPNCDNFVRLFNTSLSTDNSAMIGTVQEAGQIEGNETNVFEDIWALQGAWGFVERNYLPCESLQGYSG